MDEGVQPAQSAPEGVLPDEKNLNRAQDLEQSQTEGTTPEQEERNLDEIQGKMWSSVQLP